MNKDIIKGNLTKIKGKLQDAKGDLMNNPDDDINGWNRLNIAFRTTPRNYEAGAKERLIAA